MNWESKESQENHRLNKQKRLDIEDEQDKALHFQTNKMCSGEDRKRNESGERRKTNKMCVGEVGGGGNGDGATSAVPPCPITPSSPQVDKERNLRRCLKEFTHFLKSI